LAALVGAFATAGVTRGSFCPLSANASGCPSPLQFDLDGAVTPKKLPKHEFAPAALQVSGKVSIGGGDVPPPLREVTVDIDRNGVLDASGLPVCPLGRLAVNATDAGRRLCAQALVGTGVAHIGAPNAKPVRAALSLFNGGTANGVTKLLIQAELALGTSKPSVTVAVAKVRRKANGRYGSEAALRIPPLLGGTGAVLDFNLRINRRFMSQGMAHSYLSARCLDGRLQGSVTALFGKPASPQAGGGRTMSGILVHPCTAGGT
jgi:hypothetical protein